MLDFALLVLMFIVLIAGVLAAIPFIAYGLGILGAKRVPLKKLLLLTYGDDLIYGAMNFPGRHFDANGFVVPGLGPNTYQYGECFWITSWRRWIFYFSWLVKPVRYDEHNNPDGFGSDIYIDLSDHFVTIEVKDAETKDIPDPDNPGPDPDNPKMIAGPAASFNAQGPGSVVNPQLFVTGSPPDVFQKGILDEFKAVMRKWARMKTESGLLNAQVGGEIGDELVDPAGVNAQPVFRVMHDRWGFDLPPQSITIKEVAFSKAYQEARQAARQEAMNAQAKKNRIYGPMDGILKDGEKLSADQAVKLRALDMGAVVADVDTHGAGRDTLVFGGNTGAFVGVGGGQGGGRRSGGRKQKPQDMSAADLADEVNNY